MPHNDTLEQQKSIHEAQDQRDARKSKSGASAEKKPPARTGPRSQPTELPAQHMSVDEQESDLAVRPRFLAPDYLGSQKLQGQAALITGGDSGIGRAVAILFAREGADVAITYLSSDDDAQETKRCVEGEGRQCLVMQCDVKSAAACKKAVAATVKTFGHLDVLVNNAAFQKHADGLDDIDDDRLQETWDTNLGGYFRMTRAALPHLAAGACVINTGSVVGLRGSAHLLDYAATKGAIHAFTKSLASNLLPRGIRVNAVAPGPVWTPLNPTDLPAEKVAEFGKTTDFQRAAQPEELSPAYVFLASATCSGYITGIVLPVTGSVGAI